MAFASDVVYLWSIIIIIIYEFDDKINEEQF